MGHGAVHGVQLYFGPAFLAGEPLAERFRLHKMK